MNIKPTTDQDKLDQTLREIAELEARLEKLHRVKTALIELLSVPLPTRRADHSIRIRGGLRAPHGALQSAILGIITDGQKFTNGEIRQALERDGYPYAIDNMNVRKTLDRLAKSEKLAASHSRGRVYFSRYHKKELTRR